MRWSGYGDWWACPGARGGAASSRMDWCFRYDGAVFGKGTAGIKPGQVPIVLINGRRLARVLLEVVTQERITLAELLDRESDWYMQTRRIFTRHESWATPSRFRMRRPPFAQHAQWLINPSESGPWICSPAQAAVAPVQSLPESRLSPLLISGRSRKTHTPPTLRMWCFFRRNVRTCRSQSSRRKSARSTCFSHLQNAPATRARRAVRRGLSRADGPAFQVTRFAKVVQATLARCRERRSHAQLGVVPALAGRPQEAWIQGSRASDQRLRSWCSPSAAPSVRNV